MVFIAILFALALERYFDWGHLRRPQWFDRYCQFMGSSVDRFSPPLRLAAYLLPPVLLVGLVEYILSGWLYGVLRFVFDLLVLLYCFGPVNYWAQLYGCLQTIQQGEAKKIHEQIKTAFPLVTVKNSQTMHQELVSTIFLEGHKRIFAVLFWFAILGPMGAVLYRLTQMANERASSDLAPYSTKAVDLLDWLPARLLGFLFGLGGDFVKVVQQWKKHAFDGLKTSKDLIVETGVAALGVAKVKTLPENGDLEKEALALFDRTLIILLVLSAVLVLVLP